MQSDNLKLFDEERGLYFAPIRHHSPACAWHLRTLLREVRPRQILIEASADFEPLIPILLDSATHPPVAIVAFGEDKSISYFPFSSHAPEYVALVEGRALDARLAFIDLPAGWRAHAGRAATLALSFADERAFDVSDYTRALCRRTGCRDQNELWDHLFETRLGGDGWRDFFAAVGAYCAAVRATVSPTEMTLDGTLDRERHMAEKIEEALGGEGPIVVVTGGFHTAPLIAADGYAGRPTRMKQPAARSYLIRYSFQELDRLNGYAAGLPSPFYYERLWRAAQEGGEPHHVRRSMAADLLAQFMAHLRREKPSLTPPFPALAQALEHAIRLADLRGRPGPTRQDLLDSAQSCFVKGESAPGAPILDEFRDFLTGRALGDVPPSAGSPPLVETVRGAAKRLGFELGHVSRKTRDLDIYRSDRHQQASRFLHAMAFLETGFATRQSGPDVLGGTSGDLLFETWTVAWSPMVEARLIELSVFGETIEAVALAFLRRRLRESGEGRGASAALRLLLTACRIGLQDRIVEMLPVIEEEIAKDGDLASVTRALSELFLLWRARTSLGMTGGADAERLIGVAYRRALHLLEGLKDVKEERRNDALAGLATLREVVNSARGETAAVDPDLFVEAIERRLDDSLPPALAGAVAALAHLSGVRDGAFLVGRLRGHLEGAYLDPADNVAALNGMVAMSPELLRRVPGLLEAMDDLIGALDESRFIGLLPHLRLAFAALNPRETDEVALHVAERRGVAAGSLRAPVTYDVSQEEVAANLILSEKIRASFEADGLQNWATR